MSIIIDALSHVLLGHINKLVLDDKDRLAFLSSVYLRIHLLPDANIEQNIGSGMLLHIQYQFVLSTNI